MNFSWCYVKRLRTVGSGSSVDGTDVQLADTSGCDGCLCNAGYGSGAGSSDGDIADGGSVFAKDNDAGERGVDSTSRAVVDSR